MTPLASQRSASSARPARESLFRARRLIERARLDDALTLLRRFAAHVPDDPEAMPLLAGLLLRRHELAEAGRLIADGQGREPRRALWHRLSGRHFLAKGALMAAGAATARALALEPGNAETIAQFGDISCAGGDWAGAADHYRRALDMNPDQVSARAGLGLCHMRLGQPSLATACFSALLSRPDGEAAGRLGLARLGIADGAAQPALKQAARAAALDPWSADARRLEAAALLMLDRPAEAQERLAAAEAIDPQPTPDHLHLKADIAFARGEVWDALDGYAAALTERPDDPRLQAGLRRVREQAAEPRLARAV